MVARCKPLTKDHLPLKTTFPGTKGWSLVTGFTVISLLDVLPDTSSSATAASNPVMVLLLNHLLLFIIILIPAARSTKQLCLIHTFAYAGH